MKTVVKIFRAFLVALLVLIVGLPFAFYLLLSTEWAQERMRTTGEMAIEQLLGTKAKIGSVLFVPFNRINLADIIIEDDNGNPAAQIKDLEGRFEMTDFMRTGKIIIDYVYVSGLKASLYRDSLQAPLNIAGIISRLKKEEKEKKEPNIDLRLNTFEIDKGAFSYEVLSEPATPGRFNPNHLRLSDIDVEVFVPHIAPDDYHVRLVRLSATDHSGLKLKNATAELQIAADSVAIKGVSVALPHSLLALEPTIVPISSVEDIALIGTKINANIGISDASQVYLPDLAPIVPNLADVDKTIMVEMDAYGRLDSVALRKLALIDAHASNRINLKGLFTGLPQLDSLQIANAELNARLSNGSLVTILQEAHVRLSADARHVLSSASNPRLNLIYNGTLNAGKMDLGLITDCGEFELEGHIKRNQALCTVKADIQLTDVDLGLLSANQQLGIADLAAEVDGTINLHQPVKSLRGNASAEVKRFGYKDYVYHDVNAVVRRDNEYLALDIRSNDPNCKLKMNANYNFPKEGEKFADLICNIERFNPDTLNLYHQFPGHVLSGMVKGRIAGQSLANLKGEAQINNLKYLNDKFNGLNIRRFYVDLNNEASPGHIDIASDFMRGRVEGEFNLGTLWKSISTLMSEVFPSYAQIYNVNRWDEDGNAQNFGNDFTFDFTLQDAENVMSFFKLPVVIMDPVNIKGELSDSKRIGSVEINAPWLLQGHNLIKNTSLQAAIDGFSATADVKATTHYPTKKGPMDLVVDIAAVNDKLETNIDWAIQRDQPINGQIDFLTSIYKDGLGALVVEAEMQPGQINFGSDVWNISKSHILYGKNFLSVDNFMLDAGKQKIKIHGVATEMPEPTLNVDLANISMIDIFETLDIDKALISGDATGNIKVSQLFSKTPNIRSDYFRVKDMGYNYCIMGDGDIKIKFDNEKQAFCFDAVIDQPDGRKSYIDGSITPAREELDFIFRTDRVKVGFLKPFMAAFCSDVTGYASGEAHLYGTFKYLDLTGDIFADSVGIKLDFTGCTYYATDSIHITPGNIQLKDITIKDKYGHTAQLNGYVKHEFFNSPEFLFEVKNASNLLCYNITSKENPRWYGTVFANGGARVLGVPGHVDIDVSMSTPVVRTTHSIFTFELLDTEVAEEYSFIAFRDATPIALGTELINVSTEPKTLTKAKSMLKKDDEEAPTTYSMNLNMDITPQAELVIVMDPIARDMIKAWGEGHMALKYSTRDDNLDLRGKYTLEEGEYTFSLQDLIYRDFKIRKGSTIEFKGNPYEGTLNLNAAYEVKSANLTDLDKSFAQDKDINNTNVRVNALVHVTGTMIQPQLKFDLEFPSLNQDVYRKVRSIISTDELMDQQIIYLLALDRFYTPDYMTSTTKGSELFSVASSTISSQLSNILGKLSDNWSIAPNLRSDRGDFSDVEVDVALSSRLLNNRLLFNGNFGYRDKSLNTNQFIGDFDIEYLLNRRGNLRLKAYNRYNDQNFYLRSAQTTQGVGIILSRDFDYFLKLFGTRKKKTQEK